MAMQEHPEHTRGRLLTGLERKIVVVGGGVAGLRTAEALRRHGFQGSLVGFGAEPIPPYERPQLSKVALQDASWSGRMLPSSAEGFVWFLGMAAVGLSPERRRIELDDGRHVDFDALVIATGRRAALLPNAPEALRLRTMADAQRLRSVLFTKTGHLAIVGAGLVGSEVASSARTLGWDVTIVDGSPNPLAETLGTTPAGWVWDQHREHDVHLHFGNPVTAVRPAGGYQRVVLADGSTLDADAVLSAVGTTPNTFWLEGSGLDTTDGVRTNENQQALTTAGDSAVDIVAVGDVASGPAGVWDHWSTATTDAERAAAALLGHPQATYTPPTFSTELYTHDLHVVGYPHGTESTTAQSPTSLCVRYHEKDRLSGAVVVNQPEQLSALQREVSEQQDGTQR